MKRSRIKGSVKVLNSQATMRSKSEGVVARERMKVPLGGFVVAIFDVTLVSFVIFFFYAIVLDVGKRERNYSLVDSSCLWCQEQRLGWADQVTDIYMLSVSDFSSCNHPRAVPKDVVLHGQSITSVM